jgi:pSer/pThr/pTyr-binding forkhead associated (FHA) protein
MMSNPVKVSEHHILMINDGATRVIPLSDNVLTLGRSKGNSLVLNCDAVSRFHATLLRVPGFEDGRFGYQLIDGTLKGDRSTNGVSVNGRRRYVHTLNHADIVTFSQMVRAMYLKVQMDEERLEQYLSVISKANAIDLKTHKGIATMTRIFEHRPQMGAIASQPGPTRPSGPGFDSKQTMFIQSLEAV